MAPKYKPGGKKFPPKVNSSAKLHPVQISNSTSAMNSQSLSGLDEDTENKFELELCWCIQQLELGVNSGKLGEKQMRDTRKNLDLLKNNNVALIKKRQIMRTTFGDYRAKMRQEEKKHEKIVSSVKFSVPKSNSNKSIFIRMSQKTMNTHESPSDKLDDKIVNNKSSQPKISTLFAKNTSTEPFRFNFNQPDVEK